MLRTYARTAARPRQRRRRDPGLVLPHPRAERRPAPRAPRAGRAAGARL